MTARLSLNILGHVPKNPIDEIFYENRGSERTVTTSDEPLQLEGIERVKVYKASVNWDDEYFTLNGFYREGHLHWGFEGDFFGLYRDAYYGPNLDIYNGDAPIGAEIEGKAGLEGLKVAFGPELYWGANPALYLKYQRGLGNVTATAMFQEDFSQRSTASTSGAIPVPQDRKASLQLETQRGDWKFELGGLWAGEPRVDETFDIVDGDRVLEDSTRFSDTFGGKAKVTMQKGRWHWYAQGAVMGLLANAGPTTPITFTRWDLKDSGLGNQNNFITGLAVNMGNWQLAPNFLWQKPIVGPISSDDPAPASPRNIIDDPFAVRENRHTVAGELMIAFDPTPADWMWAWDNELRETARLAGSVNFIYRSHKTTQDAALGVLENGRIFAFPGAPPARDLWEIKARTVSKLRHDRRLVLGAYAGTAEPKGDDPRLIHRYGIDGRMTMGSLGLQAFAKFNDWGPYDYHRDFNLTFPTQLMADISYSLGTPRWFDLPHPSTRFGVRTTWRTLDRYSPRYCPQEVPDVDGTLICDPNAPGKLGEEWEIRTYLNISM